MNLKVNPYENSRKRLKLTFSERNPRHIEAYNAIISVSESQKKYSEFVVDAVLAYKALGFRMPDVVSDKKATVAVVQENEIAALTVSELEEMVRRVVSEQTAMNEKSTERLRLYEQFEMGAASEEESGLIRFAGLSPEDEEELYESLKIFSV
jgi:hypothetical protein